MTTQTATAARGTWMQFDRRRGAGWTMAHFNATDARGYFQGPICGYDPHRGLPRPSAVYERDPSDGAPRCSRCEARVAPTTVGGTDG